VGGRCRLLLRLVLGLRERAERSRGTANPRAWAFAVVPEVWPAHEACSGVLPAEAAVGGVQGGAALDQPTVAGVSEGEQRGCARPFRSRQPDLVMLPGPPVVVR
jgi:hypothetical protein